MKKQLTADVLSKITKEVDALGKVNEMCEESLSPDVFEKWLDIFGVLTANREAFNNIPPECKYERHNEPNPLPSAFQPDQIVSVVFPGNATLHNCKVFKVAFTAKSEPLYDIDVPFHHSDAVEELRSDYPPKTSFFRLHGVRQWFLSYSREDWDKLDK